MSFNGSGTFQLNSGGLPVVTGTTISSTVFNNFSSDVATGLSTAVTKDGQTTITASLAMAGFKFTGLGAGSAAGNSVRYEQVFTAASLTDAATISWDASAAPMAKVTLGGDRTLGAPSGGLAGAMYTLVVTQDGTGGRKITWNAAYVSQGGGTMPQPEGTAGAVTVFTFYTPTGSTFYCSQCTPFIDTNYIVRGSSDPTKKLRIEVDGLTTATTRVITVPDADITLPSTFPTAATQSDQETGTSTVTYVSPGRQQYHPSAAKVWAKWNSSGTVSAGYNVSSITDSGTGDFTVNYTTAFSSANYRASPSALDGGAAYGYCFNSGGAMAAGSCRVLFFNSSTLAAVDPTGASMFSAFGDQ